MSNIQSQLPKNPQFLSKEMSKKFPRELLRSEASALRNSERFVSLKKDMVALIQQASQSLRSAKLGAPTSPEVREQFKMMVQEFGKDRGRDLYFPFIGSGLGSGPFVEMLDGTVKLDMITGIGINFFGHSHPAYIEEMVDSLPADVMQGNLEPGIEMKELLEVILSKVGQGCRLNHAWLMCSGTMSNEVALKIIRQKKFPATKILAFENCFAGRSTAMQEVTDNPGYRQGQPTYGEVYYLPFYDSARGLAASIQATRSRMQEVATRYPGQFAALMIEIIQGEGGFLAAPREFYVAIFEEARKLGLAIWADEVQTFGRTGELFAYQKFSLNEWVDVVTAGKLLQACMVLYTDEYNPKPGLVAGTFSGSTVALRTARRTVEMLCNDGFLGKDGKIEKLSSRFSDRLVQLSKGSCSGLMGEVRAIGGMIAFVPFNGLMNDVKDVLMQLFDFGVVAFSCGHGPYLVRLLPPLGVMTEDDVDLVCSLIEKSLLEVAKTRQGISK